MTRYDRLWLAGAVWLGLGIADSNWLLCIASIAAFLIAGREGSTE